MWSVELISFKNFLQIPYEEICRDSSFLASNILIRVCIDGKVLAGEKLFLKAIAQKWSSENVMTLKIDGVAQT